MLDSSANGTDDTTTNTDDSTDETDDSTDSVTVTYRGEADGVTYILEITGDTYVLTVKEEGKEDKVSTGAATAGDGDKLTLTPEKDPGATFSISAGEDGITAMSGTITFDDGETASPPADITPVSEPSTLTIKNIPSEYNGYWVWGEAGNSELDLSLSFAGYDSYFPLPQIKDGKVILKVYDGYTDNGDGTYTFPIYTGNDTITWEGTENDSDHSRGLFDIGISNTPTPTFDENAGEGVAGFHTNKTVSTTFKNGAATLDFSVLEKYYPVDEGEGEE